MVFIKYCFPLFFITASFRVCGQTNADTTVIETVFHKDGSHKDGYDAGGKIIDIPDNIAARIDKKKVRISGLSKAPVRLSPGEAGTMQGRSDLYGNMVALGASFDVISIRVWEKKQWKLVYTHQ